MLPRQLYELLPFIYIAAGILCAVLIDSTIVLISSLLLVITGVFVLVMRRNFRRAQHRRHEQYQAVCDAGVAASVEKRSGIERRRREVARWPAMDDQGEKIASDRRSTERRVAELESSAF